MYNINKNLYKMVKAKNEAEFFNLNYKDYFSKPFSPLLTSKLIKQILNRVELKNSLVLDVACGSGYWGSLFKERDARVAGCDIALNPLKEARLKKVKVINSDMRNLAFKCDTFDFVFCGYALHHLKSSVQEEAISELCRIVKPEGYVITVDPSSRCPFSWSISRGITKFLFGWGDPSPDEYPLRPTKLKRYFLEWGFRDVKVSTMHLIPASVIDRDRTLSSGWIKRIDQILDKSFFSYFGAIVFIEARK